MRIISHYEEYIFETKLVDLLLESKIYYKPDFVRILTTLKDEDRIASELFKLQNEEIETTQNNITLGEKNDVILFTPTNKGTNKVKIINTGTFVESSRVFDALVPEWGLKYECLRRMEYGTIGEVLLTAPHPNYGEMLSFFISDENRVPPRACLLSSSSLAPTVPPVSISVGRFVNRLLTTSKVSFSAKELETFVNNFKAQYDIIVNEVYKDLKLVKGIDIRKYYSHTKYAEPHDKGTLWNSCMRYDKCGEFLDIYTENPNNIQLLILTEGEKIKGRALVWKLDTPDRIFMDRVYTIHDSDVNLFIDYAKKNNWLYKLRQNNEIHNISENVQLSCSLYSDDKDLSFLEAMQYPYMDTMCYLSDSGYLSNNALDAKNNSNEFYLEVRNTDGGYNTRIK